MQSKLHQLADIACYSSSPLNDGDTRQTGCSDLYNMSERIKAQDGALGELNNDIVRNKRSTGAGKQAM